MRKNCIVWGAGSYGKRLSKWITKETDYRIAAYCDMNIEKNGKKIGEYEIISVEEAVNMCCSDKNLVVVIGVFDPAVGREIEGMIKNRFPADVSVVIGHDIQNQVENRKIEEYHRDMVFKWKIDFEKHFEIWIDNIMSEVEYWVNSASGNRERYYEHYKTQKNNAFIHKYISPEIKGGEVVMDIGCGLISRFGNRLNNGSSIKLIPVDALAHFYNYINGRISDGLEQGYPCHFGLFEFMGLIFGKDYADYIIINNALDHCIDPWKSLIGCMSVLKQGGRMYLSHRRAEAVYEDWMGLHRWNIDCKDGNFLIWNKENAVNITEKLCKYADVHIRYDDTEEKRMNQMLDVEIVKKNELRLEDFFDIQEENRILISCVDNLMKKLASESKSLFCMLEKAQL